jgi:predicted SnoaL-like aldol condensation-catalyzing enzyme
MALSAQEIRNRDRVLALYRECLDPHDRARLKDFLVEGYIQHSPAASPGLEGIGEFLDWLKATHPQHRNHIRRIFAQDDHVIVHLHCTVGEGHPDLAVVDIFRLDEQGMIVEHWDVVQEVPAHSKNSNTMY